MGETAAQEPSLEVVEQEEQGRTLKKQKKNAEQVSNCRINNNKALAFYLLMKTSILPAGTTIGGGLGAIMWGAVGGRGTTLMRGAGIIGGIGAMTWPGARRTTGATGGLGRTGTAERSVVRTGGGN